MYKYLAPLATQDSLSGGLRRVSGPLHGVHSSEHGSQVQLDETTGQILKN